MTLGNLPISYDQLTPVQVIEWRNNMNEINWYIKKNYFFIKMRLKIIVAASITMLIPMVEAQRLSDKSR